jgi:flagellar motor switch protein FliG
MDGMAPVRVQDVEARHREVVQIARRMASEGLISLDRVGAAATAV